MQVNRIGQLEANQVRLGSAPSGRYKSHTARAPSSRIVPTADNLRVRKRISSSIKQKRKKKG